MHQVRLTGSGRKRTVWAAENVAVVEEMSVSEETAPESHRTVRQVAREVGISKTTVHNIIHSSGLEIEALQKD